MRIVVRSVVVPVRILRLQLSGVPGGLDGVQQVLVGDVGRNPDHRRFKRQVDAGLHAVELPELALDPAHAGRARHALDVEFHHARRRGGGLCRGFGGAHGQESLEATL